MRVIVSCLLMFFLYKLVQLLFQKIWERGFAVKVHCEHDFAYEGEQLRLVEEIENAKRFPLPAVKIKFTTSKFWEFEGEKEGVTTDLYYRSDVFSIGGRKRVKRFLTFTCVKRGYFALGDIEMFVSDYFFTREYYKKQKNNQWVYVFARRVKIPELEQFYRQILGEMVSKRRLLEDPFSFAGIRDYQSFDTMRRINWKASAKTGDLKVNTYQFTSEQAVHMLLFFEQGNVNWDKKMEEFCISLTVSMAEKFIQEQVGLSVVCNGLDAETGIGVKVGTGSGAYHMRRIDEAMARIDLLMDQAKLSQAEEFFEENMQRDGLNLIITTCQTPAFQRKIEEKKKEGYEIRWLLPHYEFEPVNVLAELDGSMRDVIPDLE